MYKSQHCHKAPTEKQIRLADDIADILCINFPQSSKDFTSAIYWKFINEHIDDAGIFWDDLHDFWNEDMMWFSPLNQ